SSPFKTPPASESRRAKWGPSRHPAPANSPRGVDSRPLDSNANHPHAMTPAHDTRLRPLRHPATTQSERLLPPQMPDPHGDHSRGGLRASPRLREARDAGKIAGPALTHGESRR